MKYQIIKKSRGRESVEFEGDLAKANARLKELRIATRRGVSGRRGKKSRVEFELRPIEEGN